MYIYFTRVFPFRCNEIHGYTITECDFIFDFMFFCISLSCTTNRRNYMYYSDVNNDILTRANLTDGSSAEVLIDSQLQVVGKSVQQGLLSDQ